MLAMINYTWHILLVALAGWMNRQQQEVIEYLKEENRILREKLGPGRIQLSLAQKRRLATAAFKVGRKLLQSCATFFSPDGNRLAKGMRVGAGMGCTWVKV
jgi:hypothetical protein